MHEEIMGRRKNTIVIGHKNPDTDSICSAIAYAALKNQLNGQGYEAGRAGELSRETAYVLRRFGVSAPTKFEDVGAQVQDISVQPVDGVDGSMTMHDALMLMRDLKVGTLPIVSKTGHLRGLITIKDLAMANTDNMSCDVLSQSKTSFRNILKTLCATLVTGSLDQIVEKGKVLVGAGSPEIIESRANAGDIVIVANRYESQLCAIELDAACIVICDKSKVAKTIVRLAEEHGVTIFQTPFDTFKAACMINQSVPVSHYMVDKNLVTFNLNDPVEHAKEIMGKVRHIYFPLINRDGLYCGMLTRRNLLNLQRRNLILVDHNEKNQCVDGFEEANILEIIDHHRIASVETVSPVYFRNQPVGCTATIILQMYREQNIPIEPKIAGILCAAILSDTLKFRSPTCTQSDRCAASELAAIAEVEMEELASSMFEAGENLDGKAAEDIFYQDFKLFDSGNMEFGVGQGSFVSAKNLARAKEMLLSYLPVALQKQGVSMVFYLLTNVLDQSSEVLYAGDGAQELLQRAFKQKNLILPGVISRKKQFIPPLLNAYQDEG
ncbi:MAG: putative manganese-dependent inorganic diphosphatase [Oscillospiraceae bacterium]|nr:putative manganese-dependent inorganic diphosphatase [Oscillospiraceae bacterium]